MCFSVHFYGLDKSISVLLLLLLIVFPIRPNCRTNVALKKASLAVIEELVYLVTLHKLFQFNLLKVSLVLIEISTRSDSVSSNRWPICIPA